MTVYFTKEHEWIAVDGDTGTVGITDYAQEQLGDITFVESPEPGATVKQADAVSVVDSVKAASDIYSPVSGEVIEGNAALDEAPETVNSDPEGDGWLFRLKLSDASELDALMDRAAYDAYVESL